MAELERAVRYSLHVLGYEKSFKLKEKQLEAIKAILDGRDCLVVLPTGFRKSIIYQCLPPVFDFILLKSLVRYLEIKSTVIAVSPLNALILEQVKKLQGKGIGVSVWKTGENVQL